MTWMRRRRSRVARRMIFLFMVCALVPVSALALFSYAQVSRQLEAQSRAGLREAGKLAGMALLERLEFLDVELQLLARSLLAGGLSEPQPPGVAAPSPRHFESIFLGRRGEMTSLVPADGSRLAPSTGLPPEANAHLTEGRPLLRVERDGASPRVFLVRRLGSGGEKGGELWAELERGFLFTGGLGRNSVPSGTELCILDGGARPLFCPTGPSEDQLEMLVLAFASRDLGSIGWTGSAGEYLSEPWTAFLGHAYGSPSWTVILSEPRSLALAPMAEFRQIFPLIAVLVVVLAFLFSHIQIRHNLEPLDRLKAATERIARRDFRTRVEVRSGDEFEELAQAISSMAGSLGDQFGAMAALGEIDRAVLSALRTEVVIEIVLARAHDVTGCDAVAVGRIDGDGELHLSGSRGDGAPSTTLTLSPSGDEIQRLAGGEILRFAPDREPPEYLRSVLANAGPIEHLIVLPLRTSEALRGILALAYVAEPPEDEDSVNRYRKLADQITVALENAGLVERLDRLTRGTLEALARTVDSKSPWTAGHSKRVADLAVRLGRAVDLPDTDLEVLYRGALLHDIGKIGIRATILNKPGRLTDEEIEQIRLHPETGFRILSPIESLADILPIVRYHHERYDGGGYPTGEPASGLPDLVRLVTVVDTYDTLVNDRPYRAGLDPEAALERLFEASGSQFDPEFVDALVDLVRADGDEERKSADAPMGGRPAEALPLEDAVA